MAESGFSRGENIGGGDWIQTSDKSGMSRLLYQAELRRQELLQTYQSISAACVRYQAAVYLFLAAQSWESRMLYQAQATPP